MAHVCILQGAGSKENQGLRCVLVPEPAAEVAWTTKTRALQG